MKEAVDTLMDFVTEKVYNLQSAASAMKRQMDVLEINSIKVSREPNGNVLLSTATKSVRIPITRKTQQFLESAFPGLRLR